MSKTSFLPRGYISSKISIPERTISDELKKNLFIIVSGGNFMKIKQFLLENHISMVFRNEDEQSVAHIIIGNSNLSQIEKYELIKLAIEYGVNIQSYDKNGVTPLHLACQYQLRKIVELLLNSGCSTNVIDNQNKTPLHYAVIGEQVKCPERSLRDGAEYLVKQTFNKKSIKNEKIIELYKAINTYMMKDTNTRDLLLHIKNTIGDFENMFPFDMKNQNDSYQQELMKILENGIYSDEDKKQMISEKMLDQKKIFHQLIESKIGSGIVKLIIPPQQTESAWSPDGINKLLEHESQNDYVMKLKESYDNDVSILNEKYTTLILELKSDIGTIQTATKKVATTSQAAVAAANAKLAAANDAQDIANADAQAATVDTAEAMTDALNIANDMVDVAEVNLNAVAAVDSNVALVDTDVLFVSVEDKFSIPEIDSQIYVNINMRTEHKHNNGNTDNIPISNKLNTLYYYLDKNIDHISEYNDINEIINYSNIQFLFIKCINIIFILKYIIKEQLPDILKKFFEIKSLLSDVHFNTILTNIKTQIKNLENMYPHIKRMVDLLNEIISFIEKKSALSCIIKYYNEYDFNTFYTNPKTNEITDIYDRPIQQLKTLPNTFNDFVRLCTNNLFETKKILFEKFIPQITSLNYPSLISNDGESLPRIGFLAVIDDRYNENSYINEYPDFNIFEYVNVNGNIINDEVFAQCYKNYEEIKDLEPPKLDDGDFESENISKVDKTLIGRIGKKNPIPLDKSKKMPSIIGKLLSQHMELLKFCIVRHMIEHVFKDFSNPVHAKEYETNLKTIVQQIHNQFNEIVQQKPGDYGFILTLVGRYVDGTIINFIKSCINDKANKLTLKTPDELSKSSVVLKTHLIQDEDTGFKLDLNNIFSELMEVYNKTEIESKLKAHAVKLAISKLRETKSKDNIHKMINYNYNLKQMDQACYKIDNQIIELLLEKGASANKQDIIGYTPIYYAIDMQNNNVIDQLIEKSSINFSNIGEQTILKKYKILLENVKYQICDEITNQFREELNKKTENKTIPEYTNVILKILLYLINHQFYIIGNNYPRMWTFEDNKKLKEKMNFDNTNILILEIINVKNNEEENEYDKKHNKELLKLKEEIEQKNSEIDRQISDLNKEFKNPDTSNERKTEIKKLITTYEKKKLPDKFKDLSSPDTFDHIKPFFDIKELLIKDITKIKLSDKVNELYESFFKEIINNGSTLYDYNKIDITTYPELWKLYFISPNNKDHDHTQIIDNISKYILEQLNLSDPDLELVSKYYKNVIEQFTKDYEELPDEYKYNPISNYALNIIIDIIIHIVQRVIMVSFFGTLVKVIIAYIMSLNAYLDDKSKSKSNYIFEVLEKIITGEDPESKLMKYIFDVLPTKLVKVVLKIYSGDNDPDRDNTIEKLLAPITNMIETNMILSIKSDSSLIENLNKDVYKFYKKYFELIISQMKTLADNYLQSLTHQSSSLEILKKLFKKASEEKKMKIE
jgi:ankyrin repeat protein